MSDWYDPDSNPLRDVIETQRAMEKQSLADTLERIAAIINDFARSLARSLHTPLMTVIEEFKKLSGLINLRPCKRCHQPMWRDLPDVDEGWCGSCESIIRTRTIAVLFMLIVAISIVAIVLGN